MLSAEGGEKREELVFTSIVFPNRSSETNVSLLVESIRAFAGSLSQAPIWCFTPKYGKQLSATTRNQLRAADVKLIPFKIEYETLRFPFTGEVFAVALAEYMAYGHADLLVWLSPNTVVLRELTEFLLQEGEKVGFRPVHHTLIGSRYDEPLDPFWTLIFSYCNVPQDRIFPMMTHVDQTTLRPYFNAGLFVSRLEQHLLQTWRDTFFKVYQNPSLTELYRKDERYTVFVHQAVLTGVILAVFTTDELQELPSNYNYPLHLHTHKTPGKTGYHTWRNS